MVKPGIRIFDYQDYREYLSAYYQAAKALNSRFSHRYIVEKVGAASTGWFADMLKGRINLTSTHRLRLSNLLELNRMETDYFESMVNSANAGSHEEKMRHLEKMMSFREVRSDLVGKDKFEYYSKWHHAVIRELLFVYDFQGDYRSLGRKLNPPIGSKQAKSSIELLQRLGLAKADGEGRFRPTAPILKKDKSAKAVNLATYLRANMQLGMESLDRFDKESRDISSLALPLLQEDFLRAREEIKALRKKMLAWSQKAHGGAKVYQCNFQVFPVSR